MLYYDRNYPLNPKPLDAMKVRILFQEDGTPAGEVAGLG